VRTIRRRGGRLAALGTAAAVALSGFGVLAPLSASAATLSAPSGLAPSDGTALLKNIELTWNPVAGATSYEVRLVDADDTVLTATSQAPRWTVPTSTPRGNYEWTVRALGSSQRGPWSATTSLRQGWDDAPTNLRGVSGLIPAFAWDPIPDASFYEVEISDRAFSDYGAVESGRQKHWICYTTRTSFAPYGISAGKDADKAPGDEGNCAFASDPKGNETTSSLGTKWIQGKDYYWRVRGRDGSVDARTTDFAVPSVGCTGVWDDTLAEQDETGQVTIPIGEKPPTYEPTPACSRWSVSSGPVTAEVPTAGTLTAPSHLQVGPTVDGASSAPSATVTASPVFSWSAVPGAFKYRVYLSRTENFLDSDVVWETQATTLAPVSDLALGATGKYWTVQACLVICGPPADVHSIRRVSATTTKPAGLRADAEGSSLFATWATQSEGTPADDLVAPRTSAKYYDVRFTNADTGDAVKVASTDRIAAAGETGLSHLLVDSSTFPEGRYTFAVRGVSETGRPLPWSNESSSVLIDRTAPTVRLTSRSGFGERQPLRLAFTEAVTRVSPATLGVRGPDGKPVPGTIRAVTPTTYDFTPNAPWVIGTYVEAWTRGVVDRAGRPAVTTAATTQLRAATTADSASTALTFVSGDRSWSKRTSSSAYGKSFRGTNDDSRTSRRAYVAATVYGRSLTVGTCKSPTSGSLQVWVDGKLRTTAKLYRSYSGCGVTVSVKGLAAARHTVKLVAVADGKRGTVSVDRVSVA
jgi:hypothetical protein